MHQNIAHPVKTLSDTTPKSINPLHPKINMHILHTILLYISHGADKENLFNNQESQTGDHFLFSHDLNV